MLDCIARAPYTQEIHSYFASNGKFVTSLIKVLLVIFLLLFIHSFQVATDFSVNPTKPYVRDFQSCNAALRPPTKRLHVLESFGSLTVVVVLQEVVFAYSFSRVIPVVVNLE